MMILLTVAVVWVLVAALLVTLFSAAKNADRRMDAISHAHPSSQRRDRGLAA